MTRTKALLLMVLTACGLGTAAQALNYHFGEPVNRYALAVTIGLVVGAVMGGRTE